MTEQDKITIVGLGLMGGSYAIALSQKGYQVYGYDVDPDSISYAYEKHYILNSTSSDELLAQSDTIILALYPSVITSFVKEHISLFRNDVILTDITGVKSGIVEEIQAMMGANQEFIAMHPMCGRETTGVRTSTAKMFESSNMIIVKTEKNTARGLSFAHQLSETLGMANTEELTISEHDQMISFLSQLPHVIAVSLMDQRENAHLIRFTGDSFRDLTRIAKINAPLWADLFIRNKENLISDIDQFIEEITEIRNLIQDEDKEKLEEKFRLSKERRQNFDRK